MNPVKHIAYHQIDFKKWDLLIYSSLCDTFYAMSWFLNSVCEDWEILIQGNYESGMFLPVRETFGLKLIYQPLPMMQLGIFSRVGTNLQNTEDFIQAIPENYKWFQIQLTKYSLVNLSSQKIIQKECFDIDLILTREMHFSRFSEQVLKKIEKAKQAGFSIMKSLAPNDIISLWSSSCKMSIENKNMIRRILAKGIQNRMCEIWGAYSEYNNLIASGVFFFFKKKIILSFTAMGMNDGLTGLVWIIHKFIEKHAEKNLILRLEQPLKDKFNLLSFTKKSSIKNLSQIYKGLGAQINQFPAIKSRTFIPLAKLLK